MKKEIRYTFVTLREGEAEACQKTLNEACNQNDEFVFVVDDEDPEYVIANERIYIFDSYFDKFLSYQNKDRINIYIAGECISPDMNIFDYAFPFDSDLKMGDRIMKTPNLLFHGSGIYDFDEKVLNPKKILEQKKKFCNFIYGNGGAHPFRDKLFYEISEYKKVDSLGNHLKNVIIKNTRADDNWVQISIELKAKYKFSITCENATIKGYTSEKLLTSLKANTVPIYWGDPAVGEYYNEKAFINCHDYSSFDEVLERIKEVDNNDDLWCQIVSEPRRTPEQIQKYGEEVKELDKFWKNIFIQDYQKARRLGVGFHLDNYFRWWSRPWKNTNVSTEKTTKEIHALIRRILTYYRYRISAKITFGKTRKRYKQKWRALEIFDIVEVEEIRKCHDYKFFRKK